MYRVESASLRMRRRWKVFRQLPGAQVKMSSLVAIARESFPGGIYPAENVYGCAKHIEGRFNRSREAQMGVGWQVVGMMELSGSGMCLMVSMCKRCDETVPTSASISPGSEGSPRRKKKHCMFWEHGKIALCEMLNTLPMRQEKY